MKFPVFCLKKNGKRDVFSCVKFVFITCDKKINIVDIFIYIYTTTTITVALYLSVVKASLCILHCILSAVPW